MSIEVERATLPCGVCAAEVTELRRGRCWGCYTKWIELRPVGRGASCVVCHERRREQLRMVELHNKSLPLCHGCGARALKLMPLPHSIEGLRAALRRDRRALDRRDDGYDQRIFPRERRCSDRRGPGRELVHADTDPAVMLSPAPGGLSADPSASFLAALDDIIIELEEDDIDVIEPTVVREIPHRPPPPLPVA